MHATILSLLFLAVHASSVSNSDAIAEVSTVPRKEGTSSDERSVAPPSSPSIGDESPAAAPEERIGGTSFDTSMLRVGTFVAEVPTASCDESTNALRVGALRAKSMDPFDGTQATFSLSDELAKSPERDIAAENTGPVSLLDKYAHLRYSHYIDGDEEDRDINPALIATLRVGAATTASPAAAERLERDDEERTDKLPSSIAGAQAEDTSETDAEQLIAAYLKEPAETRDVPREATAAAATSLLTKRIDRVRRIGTIEQVFFVVAVSLTCYVIMTLGEWINSTHPDERLCFSSREEAAAWLRRTLQE